LAVRTSSSNARPALDERSPDVPNGRVATATNGRAWGAVVLGLLAVAVLPGVVFASEWREEVELLDAAWAIPAAAVLAVAAIRLARAARRRTERTLGRVGGARTARVGRLLGVLGLALALSAAIAVGFYELLLYSE
jgi:hypothetical protein